ncbi:MAG: putative peptidoglycan lipid II flippase [Myxococcota bacterium]|jgi:putative peptidoglycan lipid II flippase
MGKRRSAVVIASLIWGASILLSRVIGLVREGVIGRVLGGGEEADVYFTAFVLPDFLGYLLAGGALSLVFIPIFNGHLARGDEEGAWSAFSAIANVVGGLLLITTPLLWLAVPIAVPLIAPGFDEAQSQTLVRLTRIMLPAQVFHLIGGLLSATLQARDRHTLPALAPLLYTASIIAGGLLGGGSMGAEGFAWGVLVGSILGPFGLPLIGTLKHGLGWRLTLPFSHPDLKLWFFRSLPIMLGFSIIVVDDWILRRQGSMLAEGSIATLQYAKTLMKVPMGVFGLAAGVATYPTITRLIGQGKNTEAYGLLSGAVRRMLVLAFGAQVALTAAGPEIARVIYGDRLLAGQSDAIGLTLGAMSLGLWAWTAQTVVSRGFYALGKTWIPTLLGTGTVLVFYPLYVYLRGQLGVTGLALASSAAITVYVILLIAFLRRRFPGEPDGYGAFFVRVVPATVAGLLAGVGLRQVIEIPIPLLQGAVLGIAGGMVFLAVALLMRVPELSEVISLITDKVGRRLRRKR